MIPKRVQNIEPSPKKSYLRVRRKSSVCRCFAATDQSSMKNILIRYGLLGGVIVTTLMWVSFPLFNLPEDFGIAEVTGYVTILLSLSAVFLAIISYRDKHSGGKISFGKAFVIGLYVTLIAGSMYSISFIIYNEITDGSFYEMYRTMQVDEVNKMAITEAEKTEKIAEIDKNIKMFSNPLVIFLFSTIAEYGFPGIIVSLIAAAVLKKKDKERRIIKEPETY